MEDKDHSDTEVIDKWAEKATSTLVAKHGTGDQTPHGNWARGGGRADMTQDEIHAQRLRAWERHMTAPTPEERRIAGEEYVRLADEEEAKYGLPSSNEDPWDKPAPPGPRPEPPWPDRFGGPWGKKPNVKKLANDPGDCTEVIENFVQIVSKAIRMLVPIEKADSAPRRISLGVVLEPDTEDLQGDIMSAADIELAAHAWMEESQAGGEMHAGVVKGAKVVESYIAPCDHTVDTAAGLEPVKKGSWLLAMRWPEEQWQKITKGEYTGYSVGGQGVRIPMEEGEGDG